jgi:hypothetical protein
MITTTTFQENYPFVSCVKSNDIEYVGIIINFDNHVVSLYDISSIKDAEDKRIFLELGEIWWWESNRKIPINIFLKKDMTQFKYSVKTFNAKDIDLIFGPIVNLNDIVEKRIKRKSIQLIRNPKTFHN